MPREAAPSRILIVDDDQEMGETLASGLEDRGYRATSVTSATSAMALLGDEVFDVLVTDLRMPGIDGLSLVVQARRIVPGLPVIVMTAYGAVDSAVESIRQGGSHYLTKPFKLDELALYIERAIDDLRVRREAKALRAVLGDRVGAFGIIGTSRAIRDAVDVLVRVAKADASVLLLGETGTGKGLFARLLHAESERASGPFVTVNCAALPEPLLESELFGHVKGAFTGATRDRIGLFVEASRGTLFLDEIGEMSPGLQAKLLDVLERRVVRAVGSSKERAIDIRVVTATHRDLDERVATGNFREDLRYRLDMVSVELPPLRKRREDIPLLAQHFFGEAQRRHPSSPARRIDPEAMALLSQARWPGNVRELSHIVERMVLLALREELGVGDIPPSVMATAGSEGPTFSGDVLPLRELSRRYAAWALDQVGGHRGRTAERLGIDMKTLARLLKEGGEPE